MEENLTSLLLCAVEIELKYGLVGGKKPTDNSSAVAVDDDVDVDGMLKLAFYFF